MLKRLVSFILLTAVIILALPRLLTAVHAHKRIYTSETLPPSRLAVVFGAGLRRDGSPTPALRDRVETAARLYTSGKVEKLLMSGSSDGGHYSEPASMRRYALQLGVPEDVIVLDEAGDSTYDTCYRLGQVFRVSEAVLVTQGWHLPRAVFTCSRLGITALGVAADVRNYRSRTMIFWHLRELFATANAMLEVYVTQPLPLLGSPEPIFPVSTYARPVNF